MKLKMKVFCIARQCQPISISVNVSIIHDISLYCLLLIITYSELTSTSGGVESSLRYFDE